MASGSIKHSVLKGEIVTVSGTTSGSGTLQVDVNNIYGSGVFVISNISNSLSDNYSVTVDRYYPNEKKVQIRYRNKGDNTAIADTSISDTIFVVGI